MFTMPPQDPSAHLDYEFDWTTWLDGDTISASDWTCENPDITLSLSTHSTSTTKIWVEGGEVGITYLITNEITTVAGRIDQRTFKLKIKEQ